MNDPALNSDTHALPKEHLLFTAGFIKWLPQLPLPLPLLFVLSSPLSVRHHSVLLVRDSEQSQSGDGVEYLSLIFSSCSAIYEWILTENVHVHENRFKLCPLECVDGWSFLILTKYVERNGVREQKITQVLNNTFDEANLPWNISKWQNSTFVNL